MRRAVIAANLKMNTTASEAKALASALAAGVKNTNQGPVDVIFCPPFISIPLVHPILTGSTVKLGAQNVYFEQKGAYTGEVSTLMLAEFCQYVIVGHSERRRLFHETDADVNKKAMAVITAGMTPIICVGETAEQNREGKTEQVLEAQVKAAFHGLPAASDSIIAYEPIWAIGTGVPSTAEGANKTISGIRRVLAGMYGSPKANDTSILYGGSVDSKNISEFLLEPEIDGALVGGASLKADEFMAIVRQAVELKSSAR